MDECRSEFAALISATLHYLQEEWGGQANLALKEPPAPKKHPEPKKQAPKPISNWILNPMPLAAESPLQYASFFTSVPLNIPIRLVLTDPSQTFFLENVARALTKFIAPAALFSGKLDTLLTNQNIQLILAPLSHLKKRFSQVELHQLLTFDGPTLLPIADHYDLESKRALWDILKRFQNTPPSS